jgi:sugar phosphate isomerase/epimerase
MKIGIDSYCYHRYFGEVYPFQRKPEKNWTFREFIARAVQLGVDGVSLESCFLPSSEPDFWQRLATMLDRHNLERVLAWGHPDGLQGGRNTEALSDLIRHIEFAKTIDSRVMRIVGSSLRFRDEPHEPQIERLSAMLREAVTVAEENGVVLAIENHIDFTASEILTLIQNVGTKNFGVNFDTGNALRLLEDPVEEAKLLVPHIYATHIKDLSPRTGGSPREWSFWESVPVGHGVIDIKAVMRVLKDQEYRGLLCVEVDCLRDPWEEDEAVLASVEYLRAASNEIEATASGAPRD